MQTPPRTKVPRRPVHGVLLLDKPKGLSSNQALQRVKWLLRAEKAGHTGTLDPMATGALPLCFGAATKFSQMHLEADKSYEAVICLGVRTDTGDADGQVVERAPVQVSQAQVDAIVPRFLGAQQQTPPMYSALKKDGKALYEYARDGIEVAREPRSIHIYSLAAQLSAADNGTPQLSIQVACSKGTYIRTLGEEMAQALGTVGHLVVLRRVKTGPFAVGQAVTIEQLEALPDGEHNPHLMSVQTLLQGFEPVQLEASEAARFLSGLRRRVDLPNTPHVAVYAAHPPAFLGSAHVMGGELIPDRLLNPEEVAQIQSTQGNHEKAN